MIIDLKYLKTTTNNDQATILALLNIFKEQVPDLKSDILQAFKEKNWLDLQKAAHKAKNSFQILGLENAAKELQELEILCKQKKDTHLYQNYINNFIDICDKAVKEIENGIAI